MEQKKEMRVPVLCANNCGFYANPATASLCPSCLLVASAKEAAPPPLVVPTPRDAIATADSSSSDPDMPSAAHELLVESAAHELLVEPAARAVSRCSRCRRKVGLSTGFRCRCGELLCGEHRYSDRHGCVFDYRAAGQVAIERDNPVVVAEKIFRF